MYFTLNMHEVNMSTHYYKLLTWKTMDLKVDMIMICDNTIRTHRVFVFRIFNKRKPKQCFKHFYLLPWTDCWIKPVDFFMKPFHYHWVYNNYSTLFCCSEFPSFFFRWWKSSWLPVKDKIKNISVIVSN